MIRLGRFGLVVCLLAGQNPGAQAAQIPSSDTEGRASPSIAELQTLAEQRYLEGDLVGAESVFLALGQRPDASPAVRSESLVSAAWLRYLGGRDAPAIEILAQALQIDPSLELEPGLFDDPFVTLFDQAHGRLETERRDEIRKLIQAAREALAAGTPVQAIGKLERALAMTPPAVEEAHALFVLGLALMKTGQDDEAGERFQEVLAVADGMDSKRLKVGALVNLGTLQHRSGAQRNAELSWERATELDPVAEVAWKNLGIVRAELGDLSAALTALEIAYELTPDDADTARLLARTLVESESADKAVQVLESSLRLHPTRSDLWLDLGIAARGAAQTEKAHAAFSRCIDLDEDNDRGAAVRAAAFLALHAVESDQPDEAERWARVALEWDQDNPDYWSYLGMSQRLSGDLEAALESFRRALEIDSSRAESAANVAGVLADLRRYSEAEQLFKMALRLDPSYAAAASGLAWIEERRAAPAPRRKGSKAIPPKKLGLRFASLDYNQLGLRGALVREVAKRSPAARTGLRKGDLILRLDGYLVLDDRDFYSYLKKQPPVEGLEIEILREARIETLILQID